MKELLKLIIATGGYAVAAPLLGWVLSRHRTAERLVLGLLVFMTSWFPSKLTLMVGSVELYRGHTKGYEFSLLVGAGIALTCAAAFRRSPGDRLVPPGLWLYLLHCALACLSLIPAGNAGYGWMAAWKFTSAALIFTGAFHAFRDDTDRRWVLATLALTLILQSLVCLKGRFLDGRWQVHGWFEHQNPMAMWSYFCAIPLLAVAFSPATRRGEVALYLGGVGAAALMILLSVSRAALAAFVAGAAVVTALAFLRGVTVRKCALTAMGMVAALAAGMLALDSLKARIQEDSARENEEDLRPILNRQARAMLADSPLGAGWNNFGVVNSLPDTRYVGILMDWDASRGFRIIDENYFAGPLTESLYWLWLAETGYAGFLSYMLFLAVTLVWCGRAWWRHGGTATGYLIGGVLVVLLLTYVHSSVERVLSQTKNLATWLIFAGFAARLALAPRRAEAPSVHPAFLPPSAIPLSA